MMLSTPVAAEWDLALKVVNLIVTLVMAAVMLTWRLSQRASKGGLPPTNGVPSPGEVWRRLRQVESTYVVKANCRTKHDEHRREHEEIWGAVGDLRDRDKATTRRIDTLTEAKP